MTHRQVQINALLITLRGYQRTIAWGYWRLEDLNTMLYYRRWLRRF